MGANRHPYGVHLASRVRHTDVTSGLQFPFVHSAQNLIIVKVASSSQFLEFGSRATKETRIFSLSFLPGCFPRHPRLLLHYFYSALVGRLSGTILSIPWQGLTPGNELLVQVGWWGRGSRSHSGASPRNPFLRRGGCEFSEHSASLRSGSSTPKRLT